MLPQRVYTGEEFGISLLISETDFNGNGIDDYTDILRGARGDAENKPKYDGRYWDEGFPPKHIGVCTDVIWRAFREAGYDLRQMVDGDIAQNHEAYPNIARRDKNIDFRRVGNLHIFFKRYAIELTTDPDNIDQWQPGDIVIFANDKHIGIISDRRNRRGWPYVIHNGGQPRREEDYLKRGKVLAHYRFDAAKIDPGVLEPWND